MIIRDEEYGRFDVWLGDDGTLDTVVSVSHKESAMDQEIRFSDTSYHRDPDTGAMTNDGFAELAKEAVEAYIERYLV